MFLPFHSLAWLLLVTLFAGPLASTAVAAPNAKTNREVFEAAGRLQPPFVKNQGQVADKAIAYVADTFACQVAVAHNGEIIYSRPANNSIIEVKERLLGPDVKIDVDGADKQMAKVSYFQGRDPSKWYTNLPSYRRVILGRMAPGIRVELKAHGHNVEKLFYLSPGANPARIRLAVEGAEDLRVRPGGELELSTPFGSMRFTKPVAYQQINGQRRMVAVRYHRIAPLSYGFQLGAYDATRELVIDPLVKVFPMNGAAGESSAMLNVATDGQGNIYAAGYNANKLTIVKLDSRLETLLGTAYIENGGVSRGAFKSDIIRAMAIDSQGHVFVAGRTYNPDHPATPGCFDPNFVDSAGLSRLTGFITKYASDLGTILASTAIGGSHMDELFAMAINKDDKIYVAGYSKRSYSESDDFPVAPGGYDTSPGVRFQHRAVVARLDNNLTTVEAGTFLKGNTVGDTSDPGGIARKLAIDHNGNVWVAGRTTVTDFPVTAGSLDHSYDGAGDIFLAKLDADLENLLVSTYLGGIAAEAPTDILLDGQGDIYLLGYTASHKFPMPAGGFDPSHSNMETDGFIVKITPGADQILAGTFLGGTDVSQSDRGDDVPAAMALTPDGKQLVVVGRTESQGFPVTPGSLDDVNDTESVVDIWTRAGNDESIHRGDGFVTVLSGDLTSVLDSTLVGGDYVEYLDDVLINGQDMIVTGETHSGGRGFPQLDFPEESDRARVRRSVILRFSPEGPTDPGNPGNNTPAIAGGGGGGGGGCFLNSLP